MVRGTGLSVFDNRVCNVFPFLFFFVFICMLSIFSYILCVDVIISLNAGACLLVLVQFLSY